jgi:hypothetical protein
MGQQVRDAAEEITKVKKCVNIYLTGKKKGTPKKTKKPCNCEVCLPARVGTKEYPKYAWYNAYLLPSREQVYFRQSCAVHEVGEITGDILTKKEWLDMPMSTRFTVSEGLIYDRMVPTDLGLEIFGTTALMMSKGEKDKIYLEGNASNS